MSGSVVIVTGASRGIGHAVTEKLLSDGHRVVVMARTAGPLNEFKDKYPDRVQVVAGDITDPKVTKEAVETATKTWSRIDALAIIHGVLLSISPIADIELDEWRKTIEINTMSAISLIKESIPELRKSKGRVILVSTGVAKLQTCLSAWGPYGASKGMLNFVGKTLSLEEPDMTVVVVEPGFTRTDMAMKMFRELGDSKMTKEHKDMVLSTPDEAIQPPEKPGNVIARLAISATPNLSGMLVELNDKILDDFQDEAN